MSQDRQPGCAATGPWIDFRISITSGRCFARGAILKIEMITGTSKARSWPDTFLAFGEFPISFRGKGKERIEEE